MNILIIGKFTEGHFGYHIADTLRDMGNYIVEFDPTVKYKYTKTQIGRRAHQTKLFLVNTIINTSFYREYRIKKLNKIFEQNKIDLTISTHDFLTPEEVMFIREKTKSPAVLWFPDSFASFNKAFFLISNYNALFFKDPYIVKVLSEQYNKKNVYYLPECCNPKYHKKINLSDQDYKIFGCDITSYGSPHNIRTSFFTQLLDYNYQIKIWGTQSPIWLKDKKAKSLYTGVYVFNESKCKAVLAAKINLNTLLPSEVIGLNARTFETAGIGGFQMLHRRPGLSTLFEDNKELVSFDNFKELFEKINYYLNNDNERTVIAEAGRIRAYKDHTYSLRLKLLLKTIFENYKGYEIPEIEFTNKRSLK